MLACTKPISHLTIFIPIESFKADDSILTHHYISGRIFFVLLLYYFCEIDGPARSRASML